MTTEMTKTTYVVLEGQDYGNSTLSPEAEKRAQAIANALQTGGHTNDGRCVFIIASNTRWAPSTDALLEPAVQKSRPERVVAYLPSQKNINIAFALIGAVFGIIAIVTVPPVAIALAIKIIAIAIGLLSCVNNNLRPAPRAEDTHQPRILTMLNPQPADPSSEMELT